MWHIEQFCYGDWEELECCFHSREMAEQAAQICIRMNRPTRIFFWENQQITEIYEWKNGEWRND